MTELVLTDNAAAVLRQISTMPERMGRGIAQAFDQQNLLTIAYAQQHKLSGPRPAVLGVVTNRLRLSLNASPAVVEGNTITSAIGTNVRYAGVHERGFEGDVQVDGYTRRILNKTASRYTFDMATGRTTKSKRKIRAVLGQVTVRPFTRHMNVPARPYLSSSIAERHYDYGFAISKAIVTAWKEGGSS